ncbi:hypothetical protein Tco_1056234 [Tanacetum coccineum]|uniref:Uncharacterized protein n=1 Tax=Tanacetum coccineum TaxID=301880 RepID=A0ABQ5H3X9_9ASTR
MVEHIQGTPAITDVAELSQRMTDFVTAVRHDTDEIYRRLDDALDDRLLISGRLNMLFRDRRAHAHTALLMKREAILSCEAWGWSMDASNIACSKVRALRTTVLAQQTEILDLRAADRAQQAQLVETLRLMSTLQTQVMIDQGVTDALAACDADRNMNGHDSVTPPFLHIAAEANLGICTKERFPESKIQHLNDNGFSIFMSSSLRAISEIKMLKQSTQRLSEIHRFK